MVGVYLRAVLLLALLFLQFSERVEANSCKPSGKLRGKKPPPGECNKENDSDCCEEGKIYYTYNKCSTHVARRTKAVLTLNSFEKGGDGGAPSERDKKYHDDDTPVVALSTGCSRNTSNRGVSKTSPSPATGGVWWRWWWTSATRIWSAMQTMITSLHAATTSSTPQREFGKHSACLRVAGER